MPFIHCHYAITFITDERDNIYLDYHHFITLRSFTMLALMCFHILFSSLLYCAIDAASPHYWCRHAWCLRHFATPIVIDVLITSVWLIFFATSFYAVVACRLRHHDFWHCRHWLSLFSSRVIFSGAPPRFTLLIFADATTDFLHWLSFAWYFRHATCHLTDAADAALLWLISDALIAFFMLTSTSDFSLRARFSPSDFFTLVDYAIADAAAHIGFWLLSRWHCFRYWCHLILIAGDTPLMAIVIDGHLIFAFYMPLRFGLRFRRRSRRWLNFLLAGFHWCRHYQGYGWVDYFSELASATSRFSSFSLLFQYLRQYCHADCTFDYRHWWALFRYCRDWPLSFSPI